MLVECVLTAMLAPAAQTPAIPWRKDIPQSLAEAEERRRPLLIRFDVDPCGRYVLPGETDELGRRVQGEIDLTECDRMERDVWSSPAIAQSSARFVTILTGDTALRTLNKRYNVVSTPTVLLADPWGNEIVRLVGYVERTVVQRVIDAIPTDFRVIEAHARALRGDPQNVEATERLARFYESAGLREFAARYYARGLLTEAARRDAVVRRRLFVGHGTNLMMMAKNAEASTVFRNAFEEDRDGPGGDVLLFGWMMAELQQARIKEAERPYRELLARFPDSKYTAKAKENFAAATARRPDAW